jgi:hypothetical protein
MMEQVVGSASSKENYLLLIRMALLTLPFFLLPSGRPAIATQHFGQDSIAVVSTFARCVHQ